MALLKTIKDRRGGAAYNMKRDQSLFEELENRAEVGGTAPSQAEAVQPGAVLRIYGWNKPAVSYGYGLKPEKYLDLPKLEKDGWVPAKRPTGGGIVFHQTNDVSFSLAAPLTEAVRKDPQHYIRILAELILKQLQLAGIRAELMSTGQDRPELRAFCFSHPEKHEIIYDGRKLVGFGQKVGRRAVLVQGNLLVDPPPDHPETRDKAISLSRIKGQNISFDEARQIIYTSASAWPMKENAPTSLSKIF